MQILSSQKTYSFIMAYLLGVEEKVLLRDYREDFNESQALKRFEDIPQAIVLRALSRAKQNFIRHHLLYTGVVTMENISKGFLDTELLLLRKHGIDLSKTLLQSGDIYSVLNYTTMQINLILPDVLEYMKVPSIKQVSSLFYMQNVDKKYATRLMTQLKDNWSTLPHGIIVVKTTKIQRELPYILKNDRNLFSGCSLLSGTSRISDSYDKPLFSWDNVGISDVTPRISEIATVTPINPDSTKWASISRGSTLYVDCDNMDIFSVMSMLGILDGITEDGCTHLVKLFIDTKSSPLWKLVNKLTSGKYTFESIAVERIKDTKSVVDMVMTVHIMKDVLVNGNKNIGILSSDSDFFGVLASVNDVNFYIGYNGGDVSSDYVSYVTEKGLTSFNMQNLGTYDKTKLHKLSLISNLCLSHMSTLPMQRWVSTAVGEDITRIISRDSRYGEILPEDEIKEAVGVVFENLKVEMTGAKVVLRSLDAEVEIYLGVA
jgi:hypothetical protein